MLLVDWIISFGLKSSPSMILAGSQFKNRFFLLYLLKTFPSFVISLNNFFASLRSYSPSLLFDRAVPLD